MAVENAGVRPLRGQTPASCRQRFPIFEQRVYINSCSQGALSDSVRDAYERYLEDWDERGAPWDYWVEKSEDARQAFAGLVGAQPDEVAVTTSVSAGLSAIATGLRYAGRSKIVTTDWEFPTVGQIWHAQELRGARVVHVDTDVGAHIASRAEQEQRDDEAGEQESTRHPAGSVTSVATSAAASAIVTADAVATPAMPDCS